MKNLTNKILYSISGVLVAIVLLFGYFAFADDSTLTQLQVWRKSGGVLVVQPTTTPVQLPNISSSSPASFGNGTMFYDTSSDKFKCRENGSWTNCIGSGGGTPGGSSGQLQGNSSSSFAGVNLYFGANGYTFGINSSTPASANLVAQGTSTAPTLDIFRVASSSNTTVLKVTAAGVVMPQNLDSVRYASMFSGSDCGAKINAASADLGSNGGTIWVSSACGTTISTAVVIPSNQTLSFIQCDTWTQSATITGGHITGLTPYGSCTKLKQANGANLAFMVKLNTFLGSLWNMELDGNKANNSGTVGEDIYRTAGTVTEYNFIHDTNSYGYITETASENSAESDVQLIKHNYFQLTGSDCIRMNNSLDALIDSNLIYYCGGSGVYLNNGGGARLTLNDFGNDTDRAIYATSTASGRSSLIINIIGNRFGNNSKEDVYIDGWTGAGYGSAANQISGNLFDGGNFRTSNTYSAVVLKDSANNNTSANTFSSNVGNTYKAAVEEIDTGNSGANTVASNAMSGTFGTNPCVLKAKTSVVTGNNDSSCLGYLLGGLTVKGSGTNSPFVINTSTGVTLLQISANGSVGIGTTTNASTLYVQGTSTLPTINMFTVASSSGAVALKVDNIGSTTITSLSVSNLTNGNCVQAGAGGLLTTAAAACGSGGSGNSAWTIGNAVIYNATSTDSVGIGTTTPIAVLAIQGSGTKDLFDVSSTTVFSSSTFFHITSAGKIGIGTTTPGAQITFASGNLGAPTGINFGDATANIYRSAAGLVKTDGQWDTGSTRVGSSAITELTTNTQFAVRGNDAGTAIYSVLINNQGNNQTYTSGTGGELNIQSSYVPASGTGVYDSALFNSTINQCIGCSGITRGINIAPTITFAKDFRALEVGSYVWNLSTSTAFTNVYGEIHNQYYINTTTAVTIPAASLLNLQGAPVAQASTTITSSTALSITASSTVVSPGVVTNAYSLYVDQPSGASNNFDAAFVGGNVGFGTGTPGAALLVVGSGTNTTAANGINFGDSTSNWYRSGASILTTDAGTVNFAGTIAAKAASTLTITGGLSQTGTGNDVFITSASKTFTSGTGQTVIVKQGSAGYQPTSGSGVYNTLELQGTVNQTGNSSGITRDIYINPTLTAAPDHRAFEIAAYTYNTGGATLNNAYEVLLNQYTLASATAKTIAAASMITITGPPKSGTGATGVTITSSTGISILTASIATTTNGYGLYVQAPSGATNNYSGVFSGGNFGVGTTTPSFGAVFTGTVQMTALTTSGANQTDSVCQDANGQLVSDTQIGGCLVSSKRFKNSIENLSLDSAYLTVMGLNPVSYYYNKTGNAQMDKRGEQVGFIAEQAVTLDKRLVGIDDKGKPYSFNYQQYTSILTAAFHRLVNDFNNFQAWVKQKFSQQDERINKMQSQIDKQQHQIDYLTGQITDLKKGKK